MFGAGETVRVSRFSSEEVCRSLRGYHSEFLSCQRRLGIPLRDFAMEYCADPGNQGSSFCNQAADHVGIEDFPVGIRGLVVRELTERFDYYNHRMWNMAGRFLLETGRVPSFSEFRWEIDELWRHGEELYYSGRYPEAAEIFRFFVDIPGYYFMPLTSPRVAMGLLENIGIELFWQRDYEAAHQLLMESGGIVHNISGDIIALCSAMIDNPDQYQVSDLTLNNGLQIRSFHGEGLDYHVFFNSHNRVTIIRGEASLAWRDRRGRRHNFVLGSGHPPEGMPERVDLAANYPGSFGRVTFRNVSETIRANHALIELISRSGDERIPQTLLAGINVTEILPEVISHTVGEYYSFNGTVRLMGMVTIETIIHEAGHNWESEGGRSLVPIFRRISWNINNPERPVRLSDDQNDFFGGMIMTCETNCRRGPLSSTLDLDEDSHPYGMNNEQEDLATIIEDFYSDPTTFRQGAREQMQGGNFELAVKYLFARYCVYEGMEYGLSNQNPSLGIFEVRQAINTVNTVISDGAETISDGAETERAELIRFLGIIEEIIAGGRRFISDEDIEDQRTRDVRIRRPQEVYGGRIYTLERMCANVPDGVYEECISREGIGESVIDAIEEACRNSEIRRGNPLCVSEVSGESRVTLEMFRASHQLSDVFGRWTSALGWYQSLNERDRFCIAGFLARTGRLPTGDYVHSSCEFTSP